MKNDQYQLIQTGASDEKKQDDAKSVKYGKLIYSEERDVLAKRFNLFISSVFGILFLILLVYIGYINSNALLFLVVMITLPFFYLAFRAILLSIYGIKKLEIREHGFFPPYCSTISVSRKNNGFVYWRDLENIIENRQLRISRRFPYLVVNLRKKSFTIPTEEITNMSTFMQSVKPYVKIEDKWELKFSFFPIHYLKASNNAHLEEFTLVLPYQDRVEKLELTDVKKVKVKENYQIIKKDGKRIGLLGMGPDDIKRIKDAHKEMSSLSKD